MIATCRSARSVDETIDLRLRADVDAARRLVEDEDSDWSRADGREITFCWLPPDSSADADVAAGRADDERLDRLARPLLLAVAQRTRPARLGVLRDHADIDVVASSTCRRKGRAPCGPR